MKAGQRVRTWAGWIFSLPFMGVALLFVAYVGSAVHVGMQSESDYLAAEEDEVVRIVHWQLEPGFREAMDEAIRDYQELPHVKGNGIRIESVGIPARMYHQFVNAHLLGGTAPDLIQLGQSHVANRYLSVFFHPLDEALMTPSRYNAFVTTTEREGEDLRTVAELTNWGQTLGGSIAQTARLQSGYVYGIPLASEGTVRFYYNSIWLQQAKVRLQESLAAPVQPPWLRVLLADLPDDTPVAITRDTPGLRRWAESPAPPQTFGQLVLLCETFNVIVTEQGRGNLSPISTHGGVYGYLGHPYRAAFLHPYEHLLDTNFDGKVTALEIHAGLQRGDLSFSDARMQAFFHFWRRMANYFPSGFGGLDREQAMRRFQMGDAMFMPGGSWDAMGIFNRSGNDPLAARFQVGVIDLPVPGPQDRWGGYAARLPSEENSRGGLHFGVLRQSPHVETVIDFLKFLTSPRQHARFVQNSGWLPIIEGVAPHSQMRPFMPRQEGSSPHFGTGFLDSHFNAGLTSLFMRYISGTMAYPLFSREYLSTINHPRLGINRDWARAKRAQKDSLTRIDRSIELVRFNLMVEESEPLLDPKFRSLLGESSFLLGSRGADFEWLAAGNSLPFPEFN